MAKDTNGEAKLTKAAFVRSLDLGMSANDVIALAKDKGFPDMKRADVHAARYYMTKQNRGSDEAPAPKAAAVAPSKAAAAATTAPSKVKVRTRSALKPEATKPAPVASVTAPSKTRGRGIQRSITVPVVAAITNGTHALPPQLRDAVSAIALQFGVATVRQELAEFETRARG